MLAQKYYRYKQHFDRDGVILSFVGFITEEVLPALGNVLKRKIAQEVKDPLKVKDVFSVFIELVQNVIRYSAEHIDVSEGGPDKLSSGIINVGLQDGKFYVGCGNTITAGNAIRLQRELEIIQGLDKAGLRVAYREKLKEKTDLNLDEGASLGLLEVARRSSEPIKFDFFRIDTDQSFYYIMSYI